MFIWLLVVYVSVLLLACLSVYLWVCLCLHLSQVLILYVFFVCTRYTVRMWSVYFFAEALLDINVDLGTLSLTMCPWMTPPPPAAWCFTLQCPAPITGFEIVVCLLLGSRRRCRGIIGPLRTYRLNSQTRSWKTEREMRREQKYRITKKPSVATGTYVQFQITVTSGSFARPDFTDAVSTSLQYFTLITRSALY